MQAGPDSCQLWSGVTSRHRRTRSDTDERSVPTAITVGFIAAIRAVPGTGSYPGALRVRLPPSRPRPKGRDPSVCKGSRPFASRSKLILPTFCPHFKGRRAL